MKTHFDTLTGLLASKAGSSGSLFSGKNLRSSSISSSFGIPFRLPKRSARPSKPPRSTKYGQNSGRRHKFHHAGIALPSHCTLASHGSRLLRTQSAARHCPGRDNLRQSLEMSSLAGLPTAVSFRRGWRRIASACSCAGGEDWSSA